MPPGRTDFRVPRDRDDLVVYLQRKLEEGRRVRPDAQAKLNLSFILGHQWVAFDGSTRRLHRAGDRPGSANPLVRVTVNKIASIVERSIAKVTKADPVPQARPRSNDDNDRDAARVGTRVLQAEFERERMSVKWPELLAWTHGAGWAYLHLYWDPEAGPSAGTMESERADELGLMERLAAFLGGDEDGQPGGEIEVPRGEIRADVIPHDELVVNPGARTMHAARWCIRSLAMTREDVWEQFGKMPDDTAKGARSFADDLRHLSDPAAGRRTSGASANTDQVFVHQFWIRKSRAAPKGRVVTWCGKTILDGPHDWPLEYYDRLPFVQFNLLPGIGTREGRTWVTDLLPMQKDYNDARSREATQRRTVSPKVLAPRSSVDRPMTSRFELIEFSETGSPPQMYLPNASFMQQHEIAMNRADSEMGERAGISEAASDPPSGMAAAAIMAVQEENDTKLALTAKELAASVSEVGYLWLMLCKQYWDDERTVRTFSEGGEIEVSRYRGADIQSELDVVITPESMMSQSKAAMVALTEFLTDRQLVTDPAQILGMLGLPGLDVLSEQLNSPTKQAHRENEIMYSIAVGKEPIEKMPLVQPWHNHMAHLARHNLFRESVEYEQLPRERQAVFDGHIAEHEGLVRGQLGVPTPPGTPQESGGGGAPTDQLPAGIDPTTGAPINPLAAAAGQAPTLPTNSNPSLSDMAGIGGPGQPGRVPGIPLEQESMRIGT